MKQFLLALSVVLLSFPTRAETIAPSDTSRNVGKVVTVEGVVSEVHHAASGKAIFIDIGERFPNNTFAGVILADDFNKFPDVDSLDGKTVDVTGMIKLYQGRTEIILNDPAQVKAR